jgi:hypothetical protein
MAQETIELIVDERPAIAASQRANTALRGTESTANEVGRSIGNTFDMIARGSLRVAEAAGGIAIAMGSIKGLSALIRGGTEAVVEQTSVMDRLLNTFRSFRIVASPTAFTGFTIGAGIAAEAVIKLLVARKALYDQESLAAARAGTDFTSAAAIGILQRGTTPGAAGVFGGMTAIQVHNIAAEFQGLEDPMDRASRAVEIFKEKAGDALPLLNNDLKGNVDQAYALATAIDSGTRVSLQHMAEDLASIGHPLRDIKNDILGLVEAAKNKITVTVATVYEGLRTEYFEGQGPGQVAARARLGAARGMGSDLPPSLLDIVASMEGPNGLIAGALANRGGPSVPPLGGTFESQMTGSGAFSRTNSMQLQGVNAQLQSLSDRYGTLLTEGITPPPDWDKAIAGLQARKKELEQQEAFIHSVDELIAQTRRTIPSLLFGKLYVTSPFEQKLSEQTAGVLAKAPSGLENFNLSQPPQPFDLQNLQAMLLRYQLPGALPRTEGQYPGLGGDITSLKVTAEDRDKNNQIQLEFLSHETEMQERLVKLTWGEDARDGVTAIYNLRIQYAQQEFDINRETMGDLLAGYKQLEDIDKARIAAAEQMAAIQDRQKESIARPAESLLTTLFTHPQNFGRQLSTTLQGAALSPITHGLASMIAQAGAPILYGPGGQGGMSGMIHGMFSGGGGTAGTPDTSLQIPPGVVLEGGGDSGMASIPYPEFLMGGGGMNNGVPFSPFMDPMLAFKGGGFAAGGGNYSRGTVGGGGGLLQMFGGGTARRFGGGFNLSALRQNFFNSGKIFTGGGNNLDVGSDATTASQIGGWQGTAAGILTSPGAAALETGIGMPLATAGIFGNNRGTSTGVAQSILGGALTGAGIGTMVLPGIGTAIGAGIGAAVGLGISAGEMLAGVVAPWRKAQELVKQRYGVTIDQTTGQHIADLANQKYGGNISVAVQSPDVRQMLQLYAAATGQRNNAVLSSTTPHAASLVEQGGTLYQQATYQFGSPYEFPSKLPTLGGPNGVNIWPNPGPGTSNNNPPSQGPVALTLNVGDKGATDFFTGNVVNPDYVQATWATAQLGSNGRSQNSALMQAPGQIIQ